jgi:hypothetical protein
LFNQAQAVSQHLAGVLITARGDEGFHELGLMLRQDNIPCRHGNPPKKLLAYTAKTPIKKQQPTSHTSLPINHLRNHRIEPLPHLGRENKPAFDEVGTKSLGAEANAPRPSGNRMFYKPQTTRH